MAAITNYPPSTTTDREYIDLKTVPSGTGWVTVFAFNYHPAFDLQSPPVQHFLDHEETAFYLPTFGWTGSL